MEHAVITHPPLLEDPFGSEREREIIADLADELQNAISDHDVGEFDGEEFGGGRCVIYMYGPDADRLFDVVEQQSDALHRVGRTEGRSAPVNHAALRNLIG